MWENNYCCWKCILQHALTENQLILSDGKFCNRELNNIIVRGNLILSNDGQPWYLSAEEGKKCRRFSLWNNLSVKDTWADDKIKTYCYLVCEKSLALQIFSAKHHRHRECVDGKWLEILLLWIYWCFNKRMERNIVVYEGEYESATKYYRVQNVLKVSARD